MSRTTFFTAAGRTAVPLVVLLLVWLVSGFYIVRGNEQAVIRRFGQLDRNPGGGVAVRSSGLRWDLPWPLTRTELQAFSDMGLVPGEFADFADPLEPGVRRFLSLWLRP